MSAVEVHHVIEGPEDGPVLVFSNSLGTTLQMWDAQAAVLAKRWRVVRYDTRGHGGSPAPPGPFTIEELAGDVLALLDRLGVETARFCGLSIGAITGMWLGAHAPDRIDRLALCCTSPAMPPPEQWRERAALVREQGTEPLADATMERWFSPGFRERRPEVVERFRAGLLGSTREGYAACCEALAATDLWADLEAIRAPTLVVAGEHDPVGTPDIARRMASVIPDARLLIVPEARHLAAVEAPEIVTPALEELLA